MDETSPGPNNETFGFKRSELVVLTLLALIIFGLIVFLNLPLANTAVPDWLPLLQNQVRLTVNEITPYIVVAVLGSVVAVAELTSTFQTYPREALRTRWARILILINMIAATLALIITRLTMPQMNEVLQVLSVGVGFQALIRTRFILAKPIGDDGEGEISLNLGWLYDQFQNLCRTQIDLELMNNRRTAVTQLLEYYPSLAELYDIAWYTIIARATLPPEQEATRLAELEKLLDPKAPEQFARSSMGLMILENGGPGYVNLLLDQAMQMNMSDGVPARQPNKKSLVWTLVEKYSLPDLILLTEQLTESEQIRNWVRDAAQPNEETSEANQKAAIAHFLVQQIGTDEVQRALADSPARRETPVSPTIPPTPETAEGSR